MKIAIYVRVSKRDMNPENQLIKLKEFAGRNNWEYDVFEEKESTRKTRPIKEEVLKKLRQKEYDGVLVWKLDRWARSVAELALEVTELYHRGINFISFSDQIDLSTPAGKFQFHMLAAVAELERDMIQERTNAGLDRARAQGKRLGRHPLNCQCPKHKR